MYSGNRKVTGGMQNPLIPRNVTSTISCENVLLAGVRNKTPQKFHKKNHLDVVVFILGYLRDGKSEINRCASVAIEDSTSIYNGVYCIIDVGLVPAFIRMTDTFSERHAQRRRASTRIREEPQFFQVLVLRVPFVLRPRKTSRTEIGLFQLTQFVS